MKFILKYILIILCLSIQFQATFAQDSLTTDFYKQINKYDISTILFPDSLLDIETNRPTEKFKRPEILGFIGDDFQRLKIHFISIIQNPNKPYEYFAFGKTKVKNNIRKFQGTLKIKKAGVYKTNTPYSPPPYSYYNYKNGYIEFQVTLFEDRKCSATGIFNGTLTFGFVINKNGKIYYDDLMIISDGFSNNQFVGTWSSYRTGLTKKCNWGDFRIPECENLDFGAGEFGVNDKYLKNGWMNYRLAWGTYPETIEVKQARQTENEEWWK